MPLFTCCVAAADFQATRNPVLSAQLRRPGCASASVSRPRPRSIYQHRTTAGASSHAMRPQLLRQVPSSCHVVKSSCPIAHLCTHRLVPLVHKSLPRRCAGPAKEYRAQPQFTEHPAVPRQSVLEQSLNGHFCVSEYLRLSPPPRGRLVHSRSACHHQQPSEPSL